MISMTSVDDTGFKFREQLGRLREKVDRLSAGKAAPQMPEEVRQTVAEIRNILKDCEREWTKTAEIFERGIQDLRLENEMLQAKGALHEAVFEDSDDGIVITTKSGSFLAVNQGFVRLVGCKTKQEVLARKIQDFYASPGQRVQMRRKVDRSGVATNFDLRLRRIDGSEVDTLHTINVRLDREGRVSGYQGIMRDITEHKLARKALQEARDELQLRVRERTAELAEANARLKAEIAERARAQEALILSEERMRAIFEAATECIFIKNRSLQYTLVNPYMAHLLELPASEIAGRVDEDLFGQEAGHHLRQVDQRVLTGETIEEEHTRPVKGLPTTFLDVRSPIRNSKGEIIGICGISRNITYRSRIFSLNQGTAEEYHSPAMRASLARAGVAANSDLIVLIEGESGSGKDYLARYIHNNSKRSGGPFYAINCAAITEGLAESELFGHEAGAYTGAIRRKRGLVELAEGGTLLLNEIGELSLPIQAKLLTFLDTFSFTRVGGERSVTVNVRIMAATNRDLSQAVSRGEFRRDLFFRLNVYGIRVPPLRDRLADIPVLTRQIVDQLARELQLTAALSIRPEDMEKLMQYSWPGNVRELKNVLERSVILSEGPDLRLDFLEPAEPNQYESPSTAEFPPSPSITSVIEKLRRQFIELALQRTDGNKCAAARILGISRYALQRQMKALKMR